ncbi:hypothetical protein DL93DRAFT_215388 [Clavulina sp. PMI_390]|nr:hypothetical protein DL93DRAFT_215388 [Clavulina sp. PMI_390]
MPTVALAPATVVNCEPGQGRASDLVQNFLSALDASAGLANASAERHSRLFLAASGSTIFFISFPMISVICFEQQKYEAFFYHLPNMLPAVTSVRTATATVSDQKLST